MTLDLFSERSRVIVGCDPDSKAHGIAIYQNGDLVRLCTMNNVEVVGLVNSGKSKQIDIKFSIEDVASQGFIYTRNVQHSKAAQSKVARNLGQCQQAQIELMLWLDNLEVPYALHKPQKHNWAENAAIFKRTTGWDGRSNKDTRSAAFFGYLEAARQMRGQP